MARTTARAAAADAPPDYDPNPALRAELMAALDVLAPQIRGLEDLSYIPDRSGNFKNFVAASLKAHRRRQGLITEVLSSLDGVISHRTDLADDGYPATPLDAIPIDVFHELEKEMADLETAAKLFEAEPPPTATVDLGTPTDKP